MRPTWRWPIRFTVVVAAFVAAVDWGSMPLHARGVSQPVTALLDSTSRMLQLPGMEVARALGLRAGHHTTARVWAVMLLLNLPCYLAGAWILRWAWSSRPGHKGSAIPLAEPAPPANLVPALSEAPMPATSAAPVAPSRRQFFVISRRVALGVAGAAAARALLDEPHNFVVTHRSIPIRGLPASLDGMTVAQLSDIHHGPWTSLAHVRRIVRATNALDVDLIALTGDYVFDSADYIRPVAEALIGLRARAGVVAVMGNHDWWEGGMQMIDEFNRVGLDLIDNDRVFLTPARTLVGRDEADLRRGLCVAGVGDLWEGGPKYGPALGGVRPELPRLLLSHNPDVAEEPKLLDMGYRVDLMLSGHTHGGQVYIPGLGTPMIPSRYGQKYASGLVRGPAFRVFISRGLGTTMLPVRFCVRPEIVVLELKSIA